MFVSKYRQLFVHISEANHLNQICNLCKYGTINIEKQNDIFFNEKNSQFEANGRLEKIEVRYIGKPKDVTLVMNRSISTPYNCAQHISESVCKSSALALIDFTTPWDMHRPLENSCTLSLLNVWSAETNLINKVFWRSCSYILGSALSGFFKNSVMHFHSFPVPNVKSGSFVHDIVLHKSNWDPTKEELFSLSEAMVNLASKNLPIERLEVSERVALEIFENSPYKCQQIPNISQKNKGRIPLYRMDTHIDISGGPLIASSGFLGKCTISAVHKIADIADDCALYRVQGLALPTGFSLNHFAFQALEKRARKLNSARILDETLCRPQLNLS